MEYDAPFKTSRAFNLLAQEDLNMIIFIYNGHLISTIAVQRHGLLLFI